MPINPSVTKASASAHQSHQSKPDPPPSTPRCVVNEVPEGLKVEFLIDDYFARRIKTRAGKMPLHKYIWENILNRAVSDHVC